MRLRELYESINLFENYQPKVTKLQTAFPNDVAEINKHVGWAVKYLKKNQAILWYVGIMEAGLTDNKEYLHQRIPPNFFTGNIFNSLDLIGEVLKHWVTTELAANRRITDVINTIRPDTNLINLLHRLTNAEAQIAKDNAAARENNTPVEILQGDQPILQVPGTGRTWWHLPYSSHKPESKFMDHCGSCQFDGNNLLSLRNAIPRPELTFEWNPSTHELYQTKGPKNSKPHSKYFPDILTLLLSPVVNGIAEESWYAATDFSIFDMPEAMINQIISTKPKLIDDQIEKYPIDFLKAPISVRSNKRFNEVAFDAAPGLSSLIKETGDIDTSNEAWEKGIQENENLLIYAPNTIDNYSQRVGIHVGTNPSILNYANSKVRNDLEILKYAVKANGKLCNIFLYISEHNKHYKELVKTAFETSPHWDITDFAIQHIDYDMCLKALENASYPSDTFNYIIENELVTRKDLDKLIDTATEANPYLILRLPEEYITFERLKKAVTIQGSVIDPNQSIDLEEILDHNQIYELILIALKTAPYLASDFIDEYYGLTDDEIFNICMVAVSIKKFENHRILESLIERDFFRGGMPTFRITSKALPGGADLRSITPVDEGDESLINAGFVTKAQYEQLVHQAVAIDGYNLKWVHDDFKNFQVYKAAVTTTPHAFELIDQSTLSPTEYETLYKLSQRRNY